MFVKDDIILAMYAGSKDIRDKTAAEKHLVPGKLYVVSEVSILSDKSRIRLLNFAMNFNALDFRFFRFNVADGTPDRIALEPISIFKTKYNPYGYDMCDKPYREPKVRGDLYERTCDVCGKNFIWRPGWVYKHGNRCACSYKCLLELKNIKHEGLSQAKGKRYETI